MLTHFSVCTGIGGIDLSAEWAGFTTVGQCEIDNYCNRVLEKHWPNIPRWRDIRDVTADSIRKRGITRRIDLLSGGIPCQPHSLAGKRKASDDERDLWPEFARIIRELNPRFVLIENVLGLVTSESGRFFGRILRDLAEMGYYAGWCVLRASDAGAPYRRERIALMGYAGRSGLSGQPWWRSGTFPEDGYIQHKAWDVADSSIEGGGRLPILTGGPQQAGADIERSSEDVAHTKRNRLQGAVLIKKASGMRRRFTDEDNEAESESTQPGMGGSTARIPAGMDGFRWPAGPGQPQHEWEPPRVATGIKNRTARLKALGNVVVPQQVFPALSAIAQILEVI